MSIKYRLPTKVPDLAVAVREGPRWPSMFRISDFGFSAGRHGGVGRKVAKGDFEMLREKVEGGVASMAETGIRAMQ